MDMLKWMNSPNYRKLEFVEEEAASGIPGNFVEPNVLFDLLIRELKKYHPSNELDIIYKAYDISREAHKE